MNPFLTNHSSSPEESRLKAVVKQKKKPFLSKQHRRSGWTLQCTHTGLWMTGNKWYGQNETKINRLGSDGRKWVWKKPGCASVTGWWKEPRVGGGSIMIWGCMLWEGLGMHARLMED